MLCHSGSALHGSAPPQCYGPTITQLCYEEQGNTPEGVSGLANPTTKGDS